MRNRHSIRLRVSALSDVDVDAVMQDLDNMCTSVVRTYVMDANKHGETISRLTDTQVLLGFITTRHYGSVVYAVVLYLSLRPSVTCQYCIEMARLRSTQTMPRDSPGSLVSDAEDLGEIWMGSPLTLFITVSAFLIIHASIVDVWDKTMSCIC